MQLIQFTGYLHFIIRQMIGIYLTHRFHAILHIFCLCKQNTYVDSIIKMAIITSDLN